MYVPHLLLNQTVLYPRLLYSISHFVFINKATVDLLPANSLIYGQQDFH